MLIINLLLTLYMYICYIITTTKQQATKKGGENLSILKNDIASWEKSKKELANIKKTIPEKSKNIFPDTLKEEIENSLKSSLKAIFETM